MNNRVTIIQLAANVYQVEVGKKAVVLKAKDENEAIKLASNYLPIKGKTSSKDNQ